MPETEPQPLRTLFMNEKPAKILTALNHPQIENYGRPISRHIDATYSHTLKTIRRLEQHELLQLEQNGRKNMIHLTPKGKKLAERTQRLLNTLDENDQNDPLSGI